MPKWPIFGVKFRTRILQNKLFHINSAEILSKFYHHKFSHKLNPIWEKCVFNFKFNAFCPVNLNQHCRCKQFLQKKWLQKSKWPFSAIFRMKKFFFRQQVCLNVTWKFKYLCKNCSKLADCSFYLFLTVRTFATLYTLFIDIVCLKFFYDYQKIHLVKST